MAQSRTSGSPCLGHNLGLGRESSSPPGPGAGPTDLGRPSRSDGRPVMSRGQNPPPPYELWTEKEHSLNYLRVWGCPAEAKVFNLNIGKLDSKTVSCHFISYLEKSKGYRFYCPDRQTKFVETRHVVF